MSAAIALYPALPAPAFQHSKEQPRGGKLHAAAAAFAAAKHTAATKKRRPIAGVPRKQQPPPPPLAPPPLQAVRAPSPLELSLFNNIRLSACLGMLAPPPDAALPPARSLVERLQLRCGFFPQLPVLGGAEPCASNAFLVAAVAAGDSFAQFTAEVDAFAPASPASMLAEREFDASSSSLLPSSECGDVPPADDDMLAFDEALSMFTDPPSGSSERGAAAFTETELDALLTLTTATSASGLLL